MSFSINNQLTKDEIRRGVTHYVNKKLLPLQYIGAFFAIGLPIYTAFFDSDTLYLARVAVGIQLFLLVIPSLLIAMLKRGFSEEKIARYQFFDDDFQVINDDGSMVRFPYNGVRCKVVDGKVLVLSIPGLRFCVLARQKLSDEQVAWIQQRVSKHPDTA